jgi:hypothetical protein
MLRARAFSGASFSMPNNAVKEAIRCKLVQSTGAVKHFPGGSLCRNAKNHLDVMLSENEASGVSTA